MNGAIERAKKCYLSVQQDIEVNIAPRQREKLASLRVLSEQEILSETLYYAMEDAFSKKTEFSDKGRRALKKIYQRGTIIREVDMGDETFIVRKSWPYSEQVIFTEVLRLPSGILGRHIPISAMEYAYYLVTNTQSGLSTDLLELSSDDLGGHWLETSKMHGLAYYNPMTHQIRETSEINGKCKPLVHAHEAGHSFQGRTNFAGMLKQIGLCLFNISGLGSMPKVNDLQQIMISRVVAERCGKERNAHAFALSAVRALREHGLDLYPDIPNRYLIAVINTELEMSEVETTETYGAGFIRFCGHPRIKTN